MKVWISFWCWLLAQSLQAEPQDKGGLTPAQFMESERKAAEFRGENLDLDAVENCFNALDRNQDRLVSAEELNAQDAGRVAVPVPKLVPGQMVLAANGKLDLDLKQFLHNREIHLGRQDEVFDKAKEIERFRVQDTNKDGVSTIRERRTYAARK
eukprot:GHVR01056958.1.p1 GENE.GHVR01056958.1~~GHVR01056958.1.p1  ORF type:complete len:154 (+),score=9.63 GHVR01056958.1:256-717(+)